jgi:hypothetical protein
MPAAATYEPITTVTHTGGSVTNITLSNIPQTYTDLVVVSNVIYSANSGDYISYRLNGNTTNNNYYMQRVGINSTQMDPVYFGDTKFVLYSGSTSQYVPFIMNVFNYTNSTNQKSVICRLHNSSVETYAGGTFTPTGAITQIDVFFAAASIAAGTTVTIYGIKAA